VAAVCLIAIASGCGPAVPPESTVPDEPTKPVDEPKEPTKPVDEPKEPVDEPKEPADEPDGSLKPEDVPDWVEPPDTGTTKPPKTGTINDIVYAKPDGRKLLLDLYLPKKGPTPRPLVILIHGGGWQKGSRKKVKEKVAPLRARGFAVAAIDYRLTDVAQFPAQIRDCLAAVRFLRANAEKYGLDPDRFGVWGMSAGAHLSALVGLAHDVEDFDPGTHPKVSGRVQAVCDWFGPSNLVDLQSHLKPDSPVDHESAESPEGKLVGGALTGEEYRERARKASPVTYVDAEAPPFLIMHGERDEVIPIEQSRALHRKLKKAGAESRLVKVPKAGHGFNMPEAELRPLMYKVVKFFETHLKPSS
jgi:acetyl esterase/lipase